MFATGETVDLAKWIIDHTCLVFAVLVSMMASTYLTTPLPRQTYGQWMNLGLEHLVEFWSLKEMILEIGAPGAAIQKPAGVAELSFVKAIEEIVALKKNQNKDKKQLATLKNFVISL